MHWACTNLSFSNSVLMEQLEAIQISNELLRGDNASVQKRIDKMQEVHIIISEP